MPDCVEIRSGDRDASHDSGLDEIARERARRMLAQALEAEVADYVVRHQERDEHGRAQVLRNGKTRPRKVNQKRKLSDRDHVYVWAEGVQFRIRLERNRLCALAMIAVRPDGAKELIAIEDGNRESTESWAELLRGLERRGMRAPVVAVGDVELGFWAALRDVWAKTREQRCWIHRIANVLDKLPKRLHARAKAALREDHSG